MNWNKSNHISNRQFPPDIESSGHSLPAAFDVNLTRTSPASLIDLNVSNDLLSRAKKLNYFVQVYPQVVDQRLPEPCPQNPEPLLRLLLWSHSNADRASLQGYARSLSKILAADLIEVDFPWRGLKSIAELSRAAEQVHPDLIITQIRHSSQLIDKFFCCSTQKQVNQLPAIMIVPDKPRWPLTNLMMALPDGNTEYECAIRWTSLLAHSSLSQVTVIPFLPPVPVFFGSYMNHSIQALLTAGDPLGSVMRSIAQKFSDENVDWVFKVAGRRTTRSAL